MKDFRGSPIVVGSRIAWPVARGSMLWMMSGVVQTISLATNTLEAVSMNSSLTSRGTGQLVKLKRVDRVVVLG